LLPKVRTSDGFLVDWNKEKVTAQLIKESVLAKEFFGISPMTKKEADLVAHIVENRVISMNLPFVSSSVVRELVNNTLLELSASDPDFLIYKNVMTRVGTPVYDAYKIDVGDGFEKNENANLQSNPETIHKKKADLMSKEQYLLLMPPALANAHHNGDIHIHTLEYFGSRPFCIDHDLRYFLYYGFIADGLGYKSSVAGPPKHAHVAVLQSVKALAASQTNFSGGQGLMNYTMFIAPYLRGLPYEDIKQLAQMVYFELTQTYIARGGQPVFSSIQIPMGVPDIWKNVPVVMKGKIGPDVYGSYEDEVQSFYRAIQEVSLKGDYWGKPFNFPKQENYVSPEFFRSEYDDLWLLAHQNVAKNGSQYFDNMIPEYRGYGQGVACYQCIPGDTPLLVKSTKGITVLPISEVKETDEVITIDGKFSHFKTMLKKPFNGELIVLDVESVPDVRCTPDHRFIKRNAVGQPEFVYAKEISVGDHLMINTKYPINEQDIKYAMTVMGANGSLLEFAEWVGYYCAEGNTLIRPSGVGGHRVQMSFNLNETEYVSRFQELTKSLFGYIFTEQHIRGNECRLLKYDIDLCHKIKESGLPEKTGRHGFIPDFIYTALPEQKKAFLKSLCNGDGSLTTSKKDHRRNTINVASRKVASGTTVLWQSLGYNPIFYPVKTRDMWCSVLSRDDDVSDFEVGLIKPLKTIWRVVKGVSTEHYVGDVYDPVEVDGNAFVLDSGLVSGNCCAYQFSSNPENDVHFSEKLNFVDGQHFSMGGWQVASINMPRLAYRANGDYDKLLEYAQENMRRCIDVFKIKKMWMDAAIRNGTLPFATQRPKDLKGKQGPSLVDFNELVYVMGVVGVNEMVEHFTGKQLHESADSVKLAVRLLIDMEKYRKGLQIKHNMKLSLARTPAESTAQTFAVQDLVSSEYRELAKPYIRGDRSYIDKKNGRDVPLYYTNGTHINVSANVPLGSKIDIEQKFFPILSGGNIFQIWMGENHSDPEGLYKVTKNIVNNSQIGYFAYTKDLTICSDCNQTTGGLLDACPTCGSKNVKNWSRITGYYSDVSGWNSSKRQELKDRYRPKI